MLIIIFFASLIISFFYLKKKLDKIEREEYEKMLKRNEYDKKQVQELDNMIKALRDKR